MSALSDVLKGQKDQVRAMVHGLQATSIKLHDPASDQRKFMIDLEIVNRMVITQNFSQQITQFGYVPLLVPEIIYKLAFSFFRRDFEYFIESPICCSDLQFIVKNEKWFAQRCDDALCIVEAILECLLLPTLFFRRHCFLLEETKFRMRPGRLTIGQVTEGVTTKDYQSESLLAISSPRTSQSRGAGTIH